MKYFKKELLEKINSCYEQERLSALEQWERNAEEYSVSLKKHLRRLPKPLRGLLGSAYGLHDFLFTDINIMQSEHHRDCLLRLSDGHVIVTFTLVNVTNMKILFEDFSQSILGRIHWGYGEFNFISQKRIDLSVLCDLNNEIQITFQKFGKVTIQTTR